MQEKPTRTGVLDFLLKVVRDPRWPQDQGPWSLVFLAVVVFASLCAGAQGAISTPVLVITAIVWWVGRYFVRALRSWVLKQEQIEPSSILASPGNPQLEKRIRQLKPMQKKRRRDKRTTKARKRRWRSGGLTGETP